MMYIGDTCSDLQSRSVSDDVKSTVNHLALVLGGSLFTSNKKYALKNVSIYLFPQF